MKRIVHLRTYGLGILIFVLFSTYSLAQVGIGNVNPNTNALLEVGDGTDTKGIIFTKSCFKQQLMPLPPISTRTRYDCIQYR